MTPTPEPTAYMTTTDEVRQAWSDGPFVNHTQAEHDAEFDAWLAAHDAQVAEKARREGLRDGWDEAARAFVKVGTTPGPPNPPTNPYRRTYA